MTITCNKCKSKFDFNDVKVNYSAKKRAKYIECPSCGVKLYATVISNQYERKENGMIVRKKDKEKMSKKERLKKRRESKNIKLDK